MVEPTMDPVVWLRKQLEEADVDLLREMVATFVQILMSAEADALCGHRVGCLFATAAGDERERHEEDEAHEISGA